MHLSRKPRTTPLDPSEQTFRLDRWVERHLTVIVRSGPEWLCVCPECGRDKMAINVNRKAWHCLSNECAIAGWTPSGLVAATLRLPRSRAREIVAADSLAAWTGPVESLDPGSATVAKRRALPQASLPPIAWGLGPDQYAYAMGRGIPPEHVELFRLGTILSDRSMSRADRNLASRIVFPIWDKRGELVSWAARAIREHPAKVINMPRPCREETHADDCTCYHEEWGLPAVAGAAEAGEVVIGLHLLRPGYPAIVVEGPVDTAVCGPGFAGILGSSITLEQAALIAQSGVSEAIVLLDGDEAGENGTPQVSSILSQALPTRIATSPWGADPGLLGREAAMKIALSAPRMGGIAGTLHARSRKVTMPKSSHPILPGLE